MGKSTTSPAEFRAQTPTRVADTVEEDVSVTVAVTVVPLLVADSAVAA
jgi:hypothetical protein